MTLNPKNYMLLTKEITCETCGKKYTFPQVSLLMTDDDTNESHRTTITRLRYLTHGVPVITSNKKEVVPVCPNCYLDYNGQIEDSDD